MTEITLTQENSGHIKIPFKYIGHKQFTILALGIQCTIYEKRITAAAVTLTEIKISQKTCPINTIIPISGNQNINMLGTLTKSFKFIKSIHWRISGGLGGGLAPQ